MNRNDRKNKEFSNSGPPPFSSPIFRNPRRRGFLEASVPGGSSRDTAAEIRCNLRSRIHG